MRAIFPGFPVLLATAALLLAAAPGAAKESEIVIAATADLHGACQQMERQIAPWLAQLRAEHPGAVLHLDCGDLLTGSAEAFLSRGAAPLAALNALECAVWVPGNHDFEYGAAVLARRVREFHGEFLCANLEAPQLQGLCRSWTIRKVNGLRIGIIGLTVPRLEQSVPPPGGVASTPDLPALRRAIAELQAEGVGFLILLRHGGPYGGFEPLSELLRDAPGVTLVIGGHTHQTEPGRQIGGAWFVQPGPHGIAPVAITVRFDARTQRILQITSRAELLPATEETVIAEPRPLPLPDPRAPAQWIAERMRQVTGSDLALYALSRAGAAQLAAAPQSFSALYNALPYYEPVLTLQLSAAELQTVFDEYAASARKRKLIPALAGGTFQLRRGRSAVLQLASDRPELLLAVTGYDAAGAGGRLPLLRELFRRKSAEGKTTLLPQNAPPLLELLTVSPKKTP